MGVVENAVHVQRGRNASKTPVGALNALRYASRTATGKTAVETVAAENVESARTHLRVWSPLVWQPTVQERAGNLLKERSVTAMPLVSRSGTAVPMYVLRAESAVQMTEN